MKTELPSRRVKAVDGSAKKRKRGVMDVFVDRRLSNEEKAPLPILTRYSRRQDT